MRVRHSALAHGLAFLLGAPLLSAEGPMLAPGFLVGTWDDRVEIAKRDDPVAAARDGQRDFDFHIGTWKTKLRRLQKPLTGSTTWVEYEGTTAVRKVWGGAANLVELDVSGAAGRIEGLNLRLYNPETRQWSLNFANRRGGTMFPPTVGEFRNGQGVFFAKEELDGRPILVRFVISDITPGSCRFEQAFSADGGKTWEVNWIAVDTRTGS